MRILHTETLKQWGGQQNRVLTEAKGLSQRGHAAIIACHQGSALAQKARDAGIRLYEVNMTKQAHLSTVPKLAGIIKKEQIDIVSTHSSVDSWAGGVAAKLAGKRLVRFRHNLYPIGKDPLTKLIYALPDRLIAISETVKETLVKRGLRDSSITVIPSSVDKEIFSPDRAGLRDELSLPHEAVVIGNTSTFTRVKGQEHLLRAFNIIAREIPCYLLFAGNLPEEKQYKYLRHVDEGLRDRVILLGHREDIARVLNTIDIFVYPSLLEGLGTALLEAMMTGRAAAVSDIPTFRNFIEDRKSGVYFSPGDSGDIAEKVILLARDRMLRERLGREARKTALERFGTEKMIKTTETCYRGIIQS